MVSRASLDCREEANEHRSKAARCGLVNVIGVMRYLAWLVVGYLRERSRVSRLVGQHSGRLSSCGPQDIPDAICAAPSSLVGICLT